MPPRPVRDQMSTAAPATSQTDSATPMGAIAEWPVNIVQARSPQASASTIAGISARMGRPSVARFHGSIAPMGRTTAAAKTKGVKAASKKGGPTESVRSKNISAMSGQIVPMKTTKVETASSRLFTTSPDSRLTVEKTPLASIAPALSAKRSSAPPMKKARIIRMNTPRSGSLAKACTEVSTPERTMNVPDQREAEGEDRQQDRPAFQRLALLHHDGGMQERRRDQPGHEGGVFDRVPEPEPAPAELVIGPPGAEPDADRQEHPGRQRPGPHPAAPGGVHPPLDQGGDGEGEGHREADVAEVEERRMEGEARVLQERVQVLPVEGRNPAGA
jgi:hypothetical protein